MSSDDQALTIWDRVDLGDQTVVKVSPSGMLKIEQTINRVMETTYLSAQQTAILLDFLTHRMMETTVQREN
jgi:hypothetical protein